jgi:hypothetical protein
MTGETAGSLLLECMDTSAEGALGLGPCDGDESDSTARNSVSHGSISLSNMSVSSSWRFKQKDSPVDTSLGILLIDSRTGLFSHCFMN